MFKLLYFLPLAALTMCGALTGKTDLQVEEIDCSPDSTYPEYTDQDWEGLDYHLPWCWTAEEQHYDSTIQVLHLEHGEGEAYVELSWSPFNEESLANTGIDQYTYELAKGTLYVLTNNAEHSGVQLILQSLNSPQP